MTVWYAVGSCPRGTAAGPQKNRRTWTTLHPAVVAFAEGRQKLGKYRIERRLAEGPIAAVYEAVDTIHGVNVALKIPHESTMDDFFLADFKREARLAQRLEHPNILPIRDASFIDGRFVIAMPLGERRCRTDEAAARHRLGAAVRQAGARGGARPRAERHSLRHRPTTSSCSPSQLKSRTSASRSRSALKASGSGTVGYIAPEQAVGRPKFQSDVFSLGLVIYELLSGHLPEWPYDWPPHGIKRVRAKLKPKLVDWLRRAIQVRPESRFRNAVTMYREFRRVRNGAAKKKRSARRGNSADDPALWQTVLFRQFQRKYRKTLETRYECRHCSGPVAELMQACPWCGTEPPLDYGHASREQAECPRCHRGVKLDWHYCPSCYGPGFEVETTRRYADRRYGAKCQNEKCRGPLMPSCAAVRGACKTKRPWKLPGGETRCPHCRWGVDRTIGVFVRGFRRWRMTLRAPSRVQ